jgi:hypothetical protein
MRGVAQTVLPPVGLPALEHTGGKTAGASRYNRT